MPGRPRRMLSNLKALEDQAHDLGNNILRATPREYISPPDREDPIWHTWRAARQSVALSAHHLGRLRYRLEQRAGLSAVGTEDELEPHEEPDPSQAGAADGET